MEVIKYYGNLFTCKETHGALCADTEDMVKSILSLLLQIFFDKTVPWNEGVADGKKFYVNSRLYAIGCLASHVFPLVL